jgi:SAM-dependent methyltransferase
MSEDNTKFQNQAKHNQGEKYLSSLYSDKRRPITDYPDKLAHHIVFELLNKNSGRLLDVGCGRGDLLKSFEKLNFDVVGVDISDEAKAMCEPIKVYKENLEEGIKNFNSNEFDIVFSKSLIEHLKDPLNFLKSCKQLVKEDGSVIIMTPSWIHHNFGPFYLDHTHFTPFTLQSLRDIGYLAGFKEVKVKYFYQLPLLWKFKPAIILSKIISFFKLPYMPMYEQLTFIKWPMSINKFIKFSREVMLYAEMKK